MNNNTWNFSIRYGVFTCLLFYLTSCVAHRGAYYYELKSNKLQSEINSLNVELAGGSYIGENYSIALFVSCKVKQCTCFNYTLYFKDTSDTLSLNEYVEGSPIFSSKKINSSIEDSKSLIVVIKDTCSNSYHSYSFVKKK